MKTAFFIQARTGSTRLPQKVLLPFDGKKTILDILIEKLKSSFIDIPIYICTSTNSADDLIETFCNENQINIFRGSENNVLKRFLDCANINKVDTIIRICADNPFLDIDFLAELIKFKEQFPEAEYWSFKNGNDVPVIKTHFGFFAEIVTLDALIKVNQATTDSLFLEHVTNYIYSHDEFNFKLKPLPDFLSNRNDLRFTIDDEIDFKNLQEIYQYYKKIDYDLKKIILFVEKNEKFLNSMISNIKKYSK